MQYVFLIRSSAGGKKYVTNQKHVLHGPETVSIFIANLHAIFNDILRKILTIFYAKTWDSLYCGRSPDVVRHWQWVVCRILKFSQIDAIDHF